MRGLQQNVATAVIDLTRDAAHRSCERERTRIIGDHQILRVQVANHVVESFELFARARPPCDEIAGHPIGIERVEGLACLKHHVVGDVNDQAHRAHPRSEESL